MRDDAGIDQELRLTSPPLRWSILAGVLLIFAVTNLPWTLDDYDQAKQAYTSFEMVQQGHWLYQHTPNEAVATKPPLVGWISTALYEVARSWEAAWRWPSLLAALTLLLFLRREASAAYGSLAGLFAMAAFGLNLLSARLATLVRTDMPLALVTFLIGWLIWRKIRRGENWSTRDRMILFVLLTITMLIKGPIVYAFILPGLVCYQLLRRKRGGSSAWSGWWPWILSLAIFVLWVVGGIVRQPGFYESVVLKEFAGRFTETVHKPQPIYFYLPHLLQKFAPWSLLVIGLAVVFWRRGARAQAATLWLICWIVGGLVLMSLIPSKRVDRIFPVIPPLCLLLGAQIAAVREGEVRKIRRWLTAALISACVFTGGYTIWKVGNSARKGKAALVEFSREVRREAAENHWRYEVVGGHEEGMLLYLRRDHFLAPNDAVQRWQSGQLDALVVQEKLAQRLSSRLPAAKQALVSEKSGFVTRYSFFVRAAP
ncbi:MAG TPA: glycosyltransferase family 39 protein [Chthoniobacterales bacterium]